MKTKILAERRCPCRCPMCRRQERTPLYPARDGGHAWHRCPYYPEREA